MDEEMGEPSADTAASPQQQTLAKQQSSFAEQLTKASAILGAFFAIGQTASQIVEGFYHNKIEEEKITQDIKLERQKSDNELASTFLNKILDKNTNDENRRVLYSALATLDGHPLQVWAKEEHEKSDRTLDQIEQADRKQIDILLNKSEVDNSVSLIQSNIEILSLKISLNHDNVEAVEKFHQQQLELAQKLSLAKSDAAKIKSELLQSEGAKTNLEAMTPNLLSDNVKNGLRSILAPNQRNSLFDKYIVYIYYALTENSISSKKLVAGVLALAATETDGFRTLVEYGSGQNYEGRKDLGNINTGDGERFKGRGLIQMTGRSNYESVSLQLGLGSLLLDHPDDINKPEISSRVLLLYVESHMNELNEALKADNLRRFYIVFNGGTNGFSSFAAKYNQVLELLNNAK